MKLSERYEILLKAIHANKDVPRQFSARHLVTRCKGLALHDPANMELKIAVVALVGATLSIKALGKLLSEVIHGRQFGYYRLEGFRTKEGTSYSCWQFTLLYSGPPVVERPKEPAQPLTLEKIADDREAADKLAADQQRRLEHAENREILEAMEAHAREKRKEQQEALRQSGARPYDEPPPRVTNLNYDRGNKPLKWKLGERFTSVMGDGVYSGDAQNKEATLDNGRILSIVEPVVGPPRGSPQAILESYVKITTDALLRGDTRSVQEIAASMRVWHAGIGIGGSIPLRQRDNFYGDNETGSEAFDRKFRGY